MQNNCTFTGDIFYPKELQGEFAVSLKLRGSAQRQGSFSKQIAEISCIGEQAFYEKLKAKGIKQFDNVTISGHLESRLKGTNLRRIMFIADELV